MRFDAMQLICQQLTLECNAGCDFYVLNDHAIAAATGSKEVKSIIQSWEAKTRRVSRDLVDYQCQCRCGESRRAGRMPIDIERERAAINRISSASAWGRSIHQDRQVQEQEQGRHPLCTCTSALPVFHNPAPNKKRPFLLPQ